MIVIVLISVFMFIFIYIKKMGNNKKIGKYNKKILDNNIYK